MIPTLETERLILRELVREDATALFPTFADPEQMRYWSRGPFDSEEELAAWLCQPGWDGRAWTVESKEDGAVLGRVVAMPRSTGESEIGYTVIRDRQGQGIAFEAMSALIDHLFTHDGMRRITADTDPDNVPSNRLLEKLGFTREGRLREAWVTHIGIRDSYIWGLLAREWEKA